MIVENQQEIIDFLSRPSSYGSGFPEVERVETHSAIVFLAGGQAYKLKRAVRYEYLDFSTADRRRTFCEAEVLLNRRTAPDLYLGVVPVTREPSGILAIGGKGPVQDWLVHMRRFDGEELLDRLAERGELDLALVQRLGRAIAGLHAGAGRRPDRGGVDGIRWVIGSNEHALAREGAGHLSEELCARVLGGERAATERQAPLLDARRRDGSVRVCHGDLHLGNIVRIDGKPVPFDAIEFNDAISCIDVLYDLAFLLMDLRHRDLRRHANEVLNAYASLSFQSPGAFGALALLPLFLSCRSAVRAMTSATAARLQASADKAAPLWQAAQAYLVEADQVLRPAPPRLIVIAGPSGTGKSTAAHGVAAEVGAAPGAVVLRSDVLRKRLLGADETSRLVPEAYTSGMNAAVYRGLGERAAAALAAGHSVIVDAVFGRDEERREIETLARAAGVPFAGIWLTAPRDVLAARIAARQDDASDATVEVLDRQLAQGAGAVHWPVVDAACDAETLAGRVRAVSDPVL